MKGKKILMIMAAGAAVTLAGCGSQTPQATATPTPVPTAAPTATPVPTVTPTPLPTASPAPRLIGNKTADAKFIYLSNTTDKRFRQIYLKVSGSEDWGSNLLPAESSVRGGEQVRMYYTPQAGEGVTYDLRFVDGDGNIYEIYSVELSDMERADLKPDTQQGTLYLSYTSLADKSQKDTTGNSGGGYDDSSSDSGTDDIYYYDESAFDYEDYNDSSDDSYYDDSYYDESYYDDSVYYDDSSDYYDDASGVQWDEEEYGDW